MPTLDTLLIFTAAALLMNISPGPSNFYVMSRSVVQGPRGGAVAATGLALGSLVHVVAAAFGLSAVFHYYPAAFGAVKIVGAAYLIYLGIRYLHGRNNGAASIPKAESRPYGQILTESILVEVLNPKTALFFLAFLPQFVDVTRGAPAPQILLLGVIVTVSAIPCDLLVAWVSGSAARALFANRRLARVQEYVSGGILIGLGLYVALSERAD
jgi:threonine/homoserine/homoserine lactone efflux protein